jgi:hypothetical protein
MNKKARSRKFAAKQSARLGAYVAAGVAASTGATSEADAAIVFFDVSPDKTINAGQQMSFQNINLVTGTYEFATTFTVPYFGLAFYGGTKLVNVYTSIEWGLSGVDVAKVSYGATINASAFPSWGNYYNYLVENGIGPWAGGADAYAALRIDAGGGNYNYGWVSINYDTAGPTATVSGFAFEDAVNTAINAGDQGGGPAPVPEPGTMAVGAGLFALAVGAHLRRRREKKAAASDALLNLAAGARGVEKFRADKAA